MNSCSVVVLVLCVVLFAKSLAGFGHPFFPIHDGDNGDSPPQIVGLFFLSAVVLFFSRCAVQHRSIFMCNIGRFGNSQDCVDACPRLNWFQNVKNNFCGPTNQSINQSIGPNFHRGQHATVAG